MTVEFGELKSVCLRKAWSHEAHDFTPWLGDNLSRLSDAIGIPLELEGIEVPIEQFSADIHARNPLDDTVVLIENQLEWSDHTHLGQILTYLAGLEARTIIWVARDFLRAHLSAINWLNENTSDSFNFLAVQVKVVKIGNSLLTPVFEVRERPSGWDVYINSISQKESAGLSKTGQHRHDFWSFYAERYPADGVRKGFAGHNPDYRIKNTELKIRRYLTYKSVGLWIAKADRSSSRPESELIDPYLPALAQALNRDLEKLRSTNSYITTTLYVDTFNRENWPRAVEWLHNQLSIYRDALTGNLAASTEDSQIE